MPRGDSSHTSLGILVRARREGLHMTMDDLAVRSRVSRSTLHRIEHDHEIRPTAPKLAQILTVLGITEDETKAVLGDAKYLGDVLHWMTRSAAFVEMSPHLQPRPALARLAGGDKPPPDAFAFKDGLMTKLQGEGVDEVKDALKGLGWSVLRPED